MNIERVRGVKFLDELRAHLLPIRQYPKPRIDGKSVVKKPDGSYAIMPGTDAHTYFAYHGFLDDLDDPNTKRLLFDARQAAQFDDLIGEGATPGEDLRVAVHAPFNKLYIELTEPLFISEGEPGRNDYLRAIIYEEGATNIDLPDPRPDAPTPYVNMDIAQVSVFLTERGENGKQTYVDRTFKMHLPTGLYTIPGAALKSVGGVTYKGGTGIDGSPNEPEDPSEMPLFVDKDTGEMREPRADEYVIVGGGAQHPDNPRYMGWFERTVDRYSDLITYIFAYTSAKSMRVVEAPLTRQEARWHHRNNTPPKPWHIIEVDPKFYRPQGDEEADEGRKHGYRYDVIGHFRAGRYRLGDGTYRHHISWVPPHQRGLANSLYIPATHHVKGGKAISPVMREVYGKDLTDEKPAGDRPVIETGERSDGDAHPVPTP